MDPALFSKILKQVGTSLLGCNLYFQGEPLLHPDFTRFLYETRKIHKTISTNGHFLNVGMAEAIMKSGA
jgi:MoaA/NifB/PqqE/SkfB family radical SAM enzyme